MSKVFKRVLFMVLLLSLLLTACNTAPAAATEESKEQEKVSEVEEVVPQEEAEEVEEITADSKMGGTFVWALTQEPGTLDSSKAAMAVEDTIMQFIGGGLVYPNNEGGYEPYLAESWTTSEDGLIWEFKLREDILFQDGNPLTAHDYAWTFNRALDPEVGSPAAGPMLGAVDSIEAIDDYTVQIQLQQPNFPLLYGLSDPGYMQPISKAAFEEMGEEAYSRNPVSVGPYKLKEWVTGEHILLERNPDYNWGPANLNNSGAYYIEFIEFRIIPEYATILAGMEAGEIDYAYTTFLAADVDFLKDSGNFEIFESLQQGLRPYISMNVTKPAFDDILVRKAINLAINRQALLEVVVQGNAYVQNGPISQSVMGYWDGIEEIGYDYDLELAKSYMEEAGYSLNSDGIFAKDDIVMSFSFITTPDDIQVKVAQVVKEQLKQAGIEINIETMEIGTLLTPLMTGDYDIGSLGMTFGEADLMYIMYHSSNIGAYNFSQLASEEMDVYLDATRNATDAEVRQQACNDAQKYIVEQAVVVPLFTPVNFHPVNSRFKDTSFNQTLISIQLDSAYLEE
ncbi:MAG: ABC transporter substrate-binding protein [Anaerolineaceae bacterium]|nr:ABC transporter substrate-binding protein [Anaerolineaceae bacterium]